MNTLESSILCNLQFCSLPDFIGIILLLPSKFLYSRCMVPGLKQQSLYWPGGIGITFPIQNNTFVVSATSTSVSFNYAPFLSPSIWLLPDNTWSQSTLLILKLFTLLHCQKAFVSSSACGRNVKFILFFTLLQWGNTYQGMSRAAQEKNEHTTE